jgi:hypothetical protein
MGRMRRPVHVGVRLTEGEAARLEELRPPGLTRSAYIRRLIADAAPIDVEVPTWGEAIRLLAESARSGIVTAQVALVRALPRDGTPPEPPDDPLERLLRED